jgi:hypothetical protein
MTMQTSKPLPPLVETIFVPINNDVTWLHAIWVLYFQLYCTKDEHYITMNETAPAFFAILKNVLFEELVLILGRLTDPASTFGKENASLDKLVEIIVQEGNLALASSVRAQVNVFRTKHSAFRTWRNARVNHNDLATLLNTRSTPMPQLPRKQVEEAVEEMAAIMNAVSEGLGSGSQEYRPFLFAQGDGNALLEALKKARGSPS